ANECESSGVKVNLIDPGPIRTHMRALAVPGEDPSILPTTQQIAPLFAELCSPEHTATAEIVSFYEWAGIKRA
ncbi:MAG: oxidoreductase, partial [Kordiimonadaceae bacterium]|nr:oxidoreductase [Kordiimonadaceae bacterium]